jgi:hypothetical protein
LSDLYRHGHDLVVCRFVEEFLAIAPPNRLGAAANGDLPFAMPGGNGLNENFPGSGLVGGVGEPVWSENWICMKDVLLLQLGGSDNGF